MYFEVDIVLFLKVFVSRTLTVRVPVGLDYMVVHSAIEMMVLHEQRTFLDDWCVRSPQSRGSLSGQND